MERWNNKVAIVTGASSGIGAAISAALVKNGMLVCGLARRIEKIEELAKNLEGEPGRLYAVKCDITNECEILKVFKWITEDIGPVHVLVNNAGLTRPTTLTDGNTSEWKRVFDVNVFALCICTREAYKIMKENNIDGHIVHINAIAGHHVPDLPTMNVYPASKFAVTALTESLRQELRHLESNVKISSISPGVVKTEFQIGLSAEGNPDILGGIPALSPEDIAGAVVYVLGTPPNVQVHEIIIKPLREAF